MSEGIPSLTLISVINVESGVTLIDFEKKIPPAPLFHPDVQNFTLLMIQYEPS